MSDWARLGPEIPTLPAGEVHVWRIAFPETGTTEASARLRAARDLLRPDELERADRFRVERAHIQFALTRAVLRTGLAGYLSRPTEQIALCADKRGKPRLSDNAMFFNVSHSGRVALLAFCRDRDLGIDVEQVWPERHSDEIAERYFSPAEMAIMRSLPPAQRKEAFFWVWVRKEAYLKARGDGLYLDLDSFDVTVGVDPAPRLLASRHHPDDVARWEMCDIHVTPEYPAALLVEGSPERVRLFAASLP